MNRRFAFAVHTRDFIEAPMVDVSATQILVDGVPAGLPLDHAEYGAGRRVQRIEPLYDALKAKHEMAKLAHPEREPPPNVILVIDPDAPAALVKSVALTAGRAGYPSLDFMVQKD